MKNVSTTNKRRAIAAVAAIAGIAAGAMLSSEDASAGRKVTGKDIASSSLSGKDLRDGTVSTLDIVDGSLSVDSDLEAPPTDVATAMADQTRGYVPLQGPEGPEGQPGATGPLGPSGITDLRTTKSSTAVGSQAHGTVTTLCPTGYKALSGGVLIDGPAASVVTNVSAPLDDLAGWQSMVRNNSGAGITANGWVTCAKSH